VTNLILVAFAIAVLFVVAFVMSRRSECDGGDDRAQRRRETIAANPTLNAMSNSARGRFGLRRKNEKGLIAEVARDSVDRPNGASSDDLDLIAR